MLSERLRLNERFDRETFTYGEHIRRKHSTTPRVFTRHFSGSNDAIHVSITAQHRDTQAIFHLLTKEPFLSKYHMLRWRKSKFHQNGISFKTGTTP